MNFLNKFGHPNWTDQDRPQGKDLSVEFKAALGKKDGILVDWYELLLSLRDEPTLFLKTDLRDFPDASGAKLLKAFLESTGKPAWPKEQSRTAVLICSTKEREDNRSILDNIFCSAVKWELRNE